MRFRLLTMGFATAAMVSLGTAAWAAGPYQIDVGSYTSGNHLFSATSDGGVDIVIHHYDPPGPFDVPLSCSSVDAEGTVYAGSNATGANMAIAQAVNRGGGDTINGSQWNGCLGPFGLAFTIEQRQDWHVDVHGTATTAVTDVLTGKVNNLKLHVYATSGCDFDVTGHATSTFDETVDGNGDQRLEVDENGFTGNLTVSSVNSNCFGLVQNGDPVDLVGAFAVTSLDGAVNVK